MEVEQVREVISLYRDTLGFAGDKSEEAGHDIYPTGGEQVRHLLHMCDRMDEVLNTAKPMDDEAKDFTETLEKIMRWLGFMQGVLWSQGIYKLAEMRMHNP